MLRVVHVMAWALALGGGAACTSNAASGTPAATGVSGSAVPMGGTQAVTQAPAAGSGGAGQNSQAGSTAGSRTTGGAAGMNATSGATGGTHAAGTNGGAGMSAAGTSAAIGGAPSAGTTATGGMGGAPAAGSGGTAGASGAPAAGSSGSAGSEPPRTPKFTMTRCIDPLRATPGKEVNFPCDGVDIWVVLPSQCMTKACGLVFNIHGGGMTDHATMDEATNMIALGSAADYIVVHPHKGTWAVSQDKNVVFDFMQQVITAFDVDKKRVHSTGYSQGGQISWAIGCEHADVVASIAPAEEINRVSDCWKTSKLPARELSVLFAYGKRDSIGGGYDAAKTHADRFAAAHQLEGPETVAGAENSKYWRQRWTGKSNNVLEFISQDYTSTGVGGILAGHCLPMATGKTFVSCSLPVDYDWGKEVIEFFKAHPMP